MIPGGDPRHIIAHDFDYTGRLMTPYGGELATPRIVEEMNVAMADRRGQNLDLDLARQRRRKVKILY